MSVGQHPGYDRLVIQFSGAIPGYLVTRQQSAAFILSPKGTPVTLEGSAGVHVVINPVLDWTSYHGPTSFHPRYPFIRQALMLENFEGYQQWGLGVQGTPCLKVFTLGAPSRLVIDVASG